MAAAALARLGRRARIALVALLLAALAAVDLATSPDVSFLVFYLLPVLAASWTLGAREGVVISVASVAIFVADDLVAHRKYANAAVPLWNHGAEFAFFVFFSWLVGAFRSALERETRARAERLEHELAVAGEVQAALLPPRRLDGPLFAAAAECRQALGVGGDAWDVTALGDGAVFAGIADVSGKGMPAALLMAGFLGSLRGLVGTGEVRLTALAAELSASLRAASDDRRFVTAFLAVADESGLSYVNAGHEPGLLLAPPTSTCPPMLLGSTGPVLGLVPNARFREVHVAFPPGASLVLCTDGLTECEDPAGAELGRANVARLAAALAGRAPERVVSGLLDAATTHAAHAPFGDDVTVLCLARKRT
jgi:serine phosphatase RsbU (regulator of sigma subunit)